MDISQNNRLPVWIAVDNYQILRLDTDLIAPLPQIRLKRKHLDISYAPVEFDKHRFTVWLPKSASIQISYRGRRYERVLRLDASWEGE